jgi:hypothetical protein
VKDDEIDPIEPSLGALFAAERARDRAPAGTRERVLERLARSVGPGGGGESGPAPSSGSLGRALPILAALATGGVLGGAIMAAVRPPQIVYVDRVVPSAPSASPARNEDVTDDTAILINVDGGMPTAAPTAAPSAARDALAEERAILDVARTALGRNDGAHAMEAVERHARLYSRGQMAEEREAIAVQALVKLGRKEEAAARGARFRARYPNSVLMGVIDVALDQK